MNEYTHRRPIFGAFRFAAIEVDESLLIFISPLRVDGGPFRPRLKVELGKAKFVNTWDDAWSRHAGE